MVSVNCLAYNHETLIACALDSILMQKVNFDFEILVHDDASNDNTARIIQAYKDKYPELINVIYERENTYSKGVKILDANIDRAQGKYIAICEGDDFWTDSNKLQKQFDFLESNPDFSLCVHASYLVDKNGTRHRRKIRPSSNDQVFTVEEIIKAGGRLFATSSMMYKSEHGRPLPDFYKIALVEDYPLMILLALKGKVFYKDELMSAYRMGLEQSWTNRTYTDISKTLNHFEHTNQILDALNLYSNFTLNETIQWKKKLVAYNRLLVLKDYNALKKPEFRDIYNALNTFNKLVLNVSENQPNLYHILQMLKQKWKRKYL